jgi:hypothetical protein
MNKIEILNHKVGDMAIKMNSFHQEVLIRIFKTKTLLIKRISKRYQIGIVRKFPLKLILKEQIM